MKVLLIILSLLSFSSAGFSRSIIFEEPTSTQSYNNISVLDGGMVVNFGRIEHIRKKYQFEQGRVRIGSWVITADGARGKVVGMFLATDKVVVQDHILQNKTWSTSKIAVTNGCVDAFCVGDKVITVDQNTGTVVGYFGNGQLVVQTSILENKIWNQNQVAFAFGCSAENCVGDGVITADEKNGRISGLFGDGRIVVQNAILQHRIWFPEQIALTNAVCTNIYFRRVHFCR